MYYSEQFRTNNRPFSPKSNCQFSFWFALDPTFGIKKPGSVSRTARWTVFLGSLTDYKAAWLVHLHKKKGDGRRVQSAAQSSVCFTTEFCCSALLPCPISHSVICLLLGVSQVSSPRPKSRVSLTFSQYLPFCWSFQGWRCRDALIIHKKTSDPFFSRD